MKKNLIVLFYIVFIFKCTSSVNVLKPQGENICIQLDDGQNITGELLAINDNVMFNGSDGILYKIQKEKINNIHIFNYSLQKKKMITLAPTILCTSWLAVKGFQWDDPVQRVILGISATLQIVTIFSGDPKVNFSRPLEDNDLDKLKLFSRYPQGLTNEQWIEILQYYKQDNFEMIQ